MSYLSHLAARALHQLPAVQPQLPSRFETPRAERDSGGRAAIEYATFTPSATTPNTVPPTAELRPTPRSDQREVISRVDPPIERGSIPAPLEPLRETRLDRRDPPSSPPAPDRVVLQPQPPIVERHIQTVIDHQPTSMIQPIEIRVQREETIERTHVIECLTSAEAAATVITPALEPAAARTAWVTPTVTPYAPPELERAPEPEAAPIIHVSIGRIEVRAVSAPATTAPPAATPRPTLSLDDYLRGVRR